MSPVQPLISAVQNLVSELREKRLWPVAAALIVALIAVPLILNSSSKPAAVAQVPAIPSTGVPVPALPAVNVTTTPSNARLTGAERNPFTQQVKASSGTGSTAGSSSSAAKSSGGGSSSGNGSSSGSGSSTSSSKTSTSTTTTSTVTPVTQTTKYFYFDVNVVFDHVGSVPRTIHNLARLSPLPNATDPLVVFLGIENDAKTAVFLLSQTVDPTGQGKCLPSRADCQLLYMKAGQAELFKVLRPSGMQEFTLSLTGVDKVWTTSSTAAKLAHARESSAGRQILSRSLRRAPGLQALGYSNDTVVLVVHVARLTSRTPGSGLHVQRGVTVQPLSASS